ncbi:ricin-type beta-trefoil lectin domain protein [Sphaerisporangium sp. TRM90804]|uniref:ricin-type beta-trefoil lectin domain protein n=1 Tax=Sphaerisporangium sp. TRM90804 TaxID=3031113 RepID=UPI00244A1B06|nr:ricin-type beta-trefoil lectin domain protein [Sphaerisporangium sp. TRM90804]MDH2430807.1 ricin-type beta-trefoil lectin domain protein [Sphaerisporangium sp. TRM90804]
MAALGVVIQTSVAGAESNGGVRVMPLGDSITDGYNVPGGYRIDLWQRLVAGGYTVDFVGSGFNGPASLGDHDHEGHSGWRIDQIDANIVGWLQRYTPRTVLLHIGTNDMWSNDPGGAANRLAALIDRITNTSPGTEVFVATIIPLPGAANTVRSFNAAIPGIVQTRANAGRRVHLVDMYNALTSADLADGIHPNAGGYNKMAAVWYNALRSVPGSLDPGTPSPTPTPTVTPTPGATFRLRNEGAGRCADSPYSGSSNGTLLQVYDCHSDPNQRFAYTSGRQLQILGKCLDSPTGAGSGTRVQLWDCHGNSNQQWNRNSNGTVTSVANNLCLNATGTGNTAAVTIATCNGQATQRWTWNG